MEDDTESTIKKGVEKMLGEQQIVCEITHDNYSNGIAKAYEIVLSLLI